MRSVDPFDIAIGSNEFRQICYEINNLPVDPNCTSSFDGMSGAFGFPDEFPRKLLLSDHPLLCPTIGLLRYLWAYRISLVRGEPRSDLASWWNAVKELAPNWPGFLSVRSSTLMLSVADEIRTKADKLTRDFDALDQKFSK